MENEYSIKRPGKLFVHAFRSSLPQGIKTSVWLLKLTIPVAFVVFLLDYFGALLLVAELTAPLFALFGLSGNAAVILITSFFTNNYSVIAVMATLDMPLREGLILANMCLISHTLIVESGIQRKTGSNPVRMVLVRISASFLAAWILNTFLPSFEGTIRAGAVLERQGFWPDLLVWMQSIGTTAIKILVLVNILLIFQKILQELGILKWLVKPFHPLLKLMGLPRSTGFLWIVAYTLGLSYGGAVMIHQTSEGKLSQQEADLLNHHVAVSHSQLEDTLLYAALGLSIPWLMLPRFVLAIGYVWARRLELYVRGRLPLTAEAVQ